LFAGTSAHYDALYSEKDYRREAEEVVALVERHRPGARTLLDVGCATGSHLVWLARRFQVEGLDLDPALLEVARRKLPNVTLSCADMSAFELGRRFDVVTCLYGSIAYAKTLEGLRSAVASMTQHLLPGGVLIVEPWWTTETYVPGTQVRHVDLPHVKLARMSVARLHPGWVELVIHYLIGEGERIEHVTERHEIGLFSRVEYEEAMRVAGLTTSFREDGPSGRGVFVGVAPR
jgi:SAM-dependent methyltransferase